MFQWLMEIVAAVDIGSNAIRLSIAELLPEGGHKLILKQRVPLRLGSEAFGEKHQFSTELMMDMENVFIEFSLQMKEYKVSRYTAAATSACRDAENAEELFQKILKSSGIKISRLEGQEEATLILNAIKSIMKFEEDVDYLLFDLGGGSLELSQIEHQDLVGLRSFNYGTVRLMNFIQEIKQDEKKIQDYLLEIQSSVISYLDVDLKKSPKLYVIGTGGNFRRMMKLKKFLIKGKESYLEYKELMYLAHLIEKASFRERINTYKLRPDRAEVIGLAFQLVLTILSRLPVKRIYAPKVGLIEALFLELGEDPNKGFKF